MRVMTATEASRSFASLLDEAERGETIVVTRGGRRIATIGPASTTNGAAVRTLLGENPVDDDFPADVAAVRTVATAGESPWPAD